MRCSLHRARLPHYSSAAELHTPSPHPAARRGPQPTGPPVLSPRATRLPLLPFSMPWGQQLSWLSVRSYPLCRNLRRATLPPSSPAWSPLPQRWVGATLCGYRGKEKGERDRCSDLALLCIFVSSPGNFHKTFLFLPSHFKQRFCCGSTVLVLRQVFILCPSF